MTISGFCSATSSPRQELNQPGCRNSKASLWCAHPLKWKKRKRFEARFEEAARFRSELGPRQMITCGHSFELVACLCYIIRPLFLRSVASFWRQSSAHREDAILVVIARKLVQRNSTTDFSIAFDANVWLGFPWIRERFFFFFFFLNLTDDESLRVGNIGLTRFWSFVDLNR